MASKSFSFTEISCLILLYFITSPSFAAPPTTPVSRETICKTTPRPSHCLSFLPNKNANVYDFGKYSILKSLYQSQSFHNSIQKYVQRGPSTLSQPTIQALKDCQELVALNMDYLSSTIPTVNKTSKTLPSLEAEELQTLLSSVLTNLQTCSESLESIPSASTPRNEFKDSISNDYDLHSVSLALFTEGWVGQRRDTSDFSSRNHPSFRKGKLPMKMSEKNRKIYEWALNHHRRRLLQTEDEIFVRDIVVVSKDGSGNFTNINDAVAVAPNNTNVSGGYFLIYITAGVYEEYVSIASNKRYLFLLGDGINQTIITGNRSVGDNSTTFNSATLATVGRGFVAVDITIRNTAGPSKGQAVALRSGADMSTFYRCSFEAYQDTLYTHSNRQFYRECDIYGTVDFIFGNAAVVLQNCNIYPCLPNPGQFNAITAQGRTDPNQNTGTSIHNCTIRPADDLASSNGTTRTYLGRPWKEYSRTVYMQSFMDSFIQPAGWREWTGDFALATLYYAEFNNSGPGSNTSSRVTWTGYHVINSTDAGNFTVSNFLLGDNWLPQTGVPYTGGLTS